MNATDASRLPELLEKNEERLVTEWTRQMNGPDVRNDALRARETQEQCSEMIRLMVEATRSGNVT